MEQRAISHFQVLEKLGSGGMGVVFKARDLRLGRTVALKLLPPGMSADEEGKALLLHEAQMVARLDHPHICGVYEVDHAEDGSLFLAMPYYPGESLAARLAHGELPVDEALVLGIQIAEALAAAHAHDVVHRDVKPSNILLAADGNAKLLDFGLALAASSDPTTPAGLGPGTLRYMSPEQVRGLKIDARTDLWSLGATLYEALAGRPCFTGADPASTMKQIVSRPPPPLRQSNPRVPPDLDDVIGRCLEKDREDRYPDAGSLLHDLRRVRDSLDAPTRRDVVPPVEPAAAGDATGPAAAPPRRPRPRHRRLLAAVLVLAAAGAVLLLLRPWSTAADDAVPTLMVLPFANLTGDPALDYVGDGIASGLIGKLSDVEGLRVVGRSVAVRYRDLGAPEAGRLLGASQMVDGDVQRGGDVLRVTVHLTDGLDGTVLWTETFEGTENGIFGLQHRIAGGLSDALELSLSGEQRHRLERGPTGSRRAYRLYLQARRLLDASPEAGAAELAERQLREAIRLDGRFALAHTALSEALWRRFRLGGDAALARESERAAERARELAPSLPEAAVALARAQRASGRVESSIAGIQAVLADHPHSAEALRELGVSYQAVGDMAEAERCFRGAVSLMPDDWRGWNALGTFLVEAGDFAGAGEAYRKAAQLAPPSVTWPQQNEAAVLLFQGEFQQAVEAFERIGGSATDPRLASNMATAYFFLGQLQQAEELYRRAVSLDPDDAELHRNLGDLYQRQDRRDEAVASYRRALALVERALRSEHHPVRLPLERAVLVAKIGDCERATTGLSELAASLPGAHSWHDAAQVWALCGDAEAALDALDQAIAAGWSAELVREEDEFRSLAGSPRFRELVEGR